MSTKYNPQVIQTFADRLYAEAHRIVLFCTGLGIISGLVVGFTLETVAQADIGGAWLGGGLFGLIGYAIGRERSFTLRFQAQTALCQLQIEENTRSKA